MYSSTPKAIAPIAGTVLGASVLPQTGMSNAVQIAVAAAVGLAVWAMAYMAVTKFGKR